MVKEAVKLRSAWAAALLASLIAGHAAAEESAHARLTSIMNSVFGPGTWRITGGFRTPERENALRRQGAMTVRPGAISRHSLGTPDAPGAYDIVVDGMSPFEAADRLRLAGAPFARYMPKGAHGNQGPHLHLEPHSFDLRSTGATAPMLIHASYVTPVRARDTRAFPAHAGRGMPIVVEGVGRKRTVSQVESPEPREAPPTPRTAARDEFARLRTSAMRDDPQAQLQLGRAYLTGEAGRRDLRSALKWMNLAASNPKADDQTRNEAAAEMEKLADEGSGTIQLAKRDR